MALQSAAAGLRAGLAYGAPGLPLAFVALPLYVLLPNHYAAQFGVPLAALGATLLAVRVFDAVVDPLIGRAADRLFARSPWHAWAVAAACAALLALGFRGLFFPPVTGTAALLAWCAALLALTCTAYSVVSVIHQAWGARLGGDAAQRAGIVAWREGLALAGVLLASVLPSLAGLDMATLVFAMALLVALAAWRVAPAPSGPSTETGSPSLRLPFATPAFRRLLAIYLVNGIAAAVPATLVLFFVRDRLEASGWEPLFLACYFAAAALSTPLWVRLVKRLGLARSWLAGMLLAIVAFAGTAALGSGDTLPFTAVCLASGIALGADLTLPAALLAGVVQRAGQAGRAEGVYFGWWNFATKLNLALAAGVALPVLQWLGYTPGSQDAAALSALTAAYALLPCALKLGAAVLLALLWIRPEVEGC
ncbi:MAG: MFS transporter [Piscinibacter sp.]|nr:MFS transporter [Piscinibacter sp.]